MEKDAFGYSSEILQETGLWRVWAELNLKQEGKWTD